MSALKPLAGKGTGNIAVILPDTVTAQHFGEFDAPDLKKSFRQAGLKPSQYTVQQPPGSEQFTAAQKAINGGASVLILDARYSGVGVQIETYAKSRGVPVIDYDWLTIGGTRKYYVGFDSWKIGVLLGQGLVSCLSAWKVKNPHIIVMNGGPTDYNSALYAQGYNAILARQFHGRWEKVSPGTWDQAAALKGFQTQYDAHHDINAALIPNDTNAAPIIQYLQSKPIKAKPRTFPTTGLDATLPGLQNVLTGYQCGTVYKPIYLEAQAAAALAIYLWAGVTPPTTYRRAVAASPVGLVNGSITDPQDRIPVASVLLTPEWVTTANMFSTVIEDNFVRVPQLCSLKSLNACLWPVLPAVPDR